MWTQLIPLIANIAWALVKKWISNDAQKKEWEEKIRKVTEAYNAGVLEAAELKAKYEDQRRRLKEEIKKHWENKPTINE